MLVLVLYIERCAPYPTDGPVRRIPLRHPPLVAHFETSVDVSQLRRALGRELDELQAAVA